MQSALCTGITVVNPCIYQCFQCKFQGVCLLEDLLKPSDRVGRSSLVIFMPTEADWNTGPKITIAALLIKKIRTWKKIISFSVQSGHDVVNSRELPYPLPIYSDCCVIESLIIVFCTDSSQTDNFGGVPY